MPRLAPDAWICVLPKSRTPSVGAGRIMLTWLWLSALALLIGGEINSEAQRSLRQHPNR